MMLAPDAAASASSPTDMRKRYRRMYGQSLVKKRTESLYGYAAF